MLGLFNFFKSPIKDKTPDTTVAAVAITLPNEIWLEIYSYLHPMQLLEFALLGQSFLGMTQEKNHFQSIVWRELLKNAFPTSSLTDNYREQCRQLYLTDWRNTSLHLRTVMTLTDRGNLHGLKKALAQTTFNPGDLMITRHYVGVYENDDNLLWKIRATGDEAIYGIFYEAIESWYRNKSYEANPFACYFNIYSIRDSAGNWLFHWQAALGKQIFWFVRDLEHIYYKNIKRRTFRYNHRRETPMHLAAAMDRVTFPEIFIRGGDYDRYGFTPFQQAIMHRSLKVINYTFALSWQNRLWNQERQATFLTFILAASRGLNEVILRFWNEWNEPLRIRNFDNKRLSYTYMRAFGEAARYGHKETLQLLLTLSPEYIAQTPFPIALSHPLEEASLGGHVDIIPFLWGLCQQKQLAIRYSDIHGVISFAIDQNHMTLIATWLKIATDNPFFTDLDPNNKMLTLLQQQGAAETPQRCLR